MSEDNKPPRDKLDITLKILTPIIVGALIAWAGFVGDKALTSISSKQEGARLITELQIRREQAESELRKDVFDQALQAFLLKGKKQDDSIEGMSKQLLRLELLALNFGESLSLSPLFTELQKDLNNLTIDSDRQDKAVGKLRKRLNSLARRVASAHVSSLEQHGKVVKFRVPLIKRSQNSESGCLTGSYIDYSWPEKKLKENVVREMYDSAEEYNNEYVKIYNEYRLFELHGIKRYLDVIISNIDECTKSADVTIILYKEAVHQNSEDEEAPPDVNDGLEDEEAPPDVNDGLEDEEAPPDVNDGLEDEEAPPDVNKGLEDVIMRNFKLDYFNFPMVDNTRLSNSHRFAIVLDGFDDLSSDDPHIDLVGIVFPAEYASLRDRPGMEEARKLLESALKNDSNGN